MLLALQGCPQGVPRQGGAFHADGILGNSRKRRQLAKLITIYARLGSTGTPYWLPMVGRFTDQDPFRRAPVTMNESEPEEAAQATPS